MGKSWNVGPFKSREAGLTTAAVDNVGACANNKGDVDSKEEVVVVEAGAMAFEIEMSIAPVLECLGIPLR